jgi:hypothetical protein
MANDTPELIWNEVNCTTGEVIVRPYTDEERADYERFQAEAATARANREAENARVDALKTSAKMKLVAGEPLTEDEAAVLVI